MKLNLKQHAIQFGGGVCPGCVRPGLCIIAVASSMYSQVVLAQASTPAIASAPVSSENTTNVSQLPEVTVYGKLDQARSQISPDLGATAYSVNKAQIESLSQGDNAPFNQVILRAPGVAQDSSANGD